MNLNISEIVSNKLKQMEEDRVIEKQIELSIENTITKAVKDACEDYSFRNNIEKLISKEVSEVATNIGFSGYNQFIAETMQNIINNQMKEDVQNKIMATFNALFINKVEKAKLSEIAHKYHELMNDLDEDEKSEAEDGYFYVSFSKEEDRSYTSSEWWTLTFALKPQSKGSYYSSYSSKNSDDSKLELRIFGDKGKDYTISSIKYEGKDLSKMSELRYMSDFECYLASLYFNETKIEFDINEDDVDTSLGLDW